MRLVCLLGAIACTSHAIYIESRPSSGSEVRITFPATVRNGSSVNNLVLDLEEIEAITRETFRELLARGDGISLILERDSWYAFGTNGLNSWISKNQLNPLTRGLIEAVNDFKFDPESQTLVATQRRIFTPSIQSAVDDDDAQEIRRVNIAKGVLCAASASCLGAIGYMIYVILQF